MNSREKVLAAFHEPCGYFNQEPYEQRNYIDGMFHVGMLAYAARKVGDFTLELKSSNYITDLVLFECRCYGPKKLTDSWEIVDTNQVTYGHMKPQCFAGKAAYQIYLGIFTDIVTPLKAIGMVLAYTLLPFLFFCKPFRQHLNSVMLAHLLLGIKPLWYKERLTKNNPVYAYIFGVKLDSYEPYPNISAWPAKDLCNWDGKTVKEDEYTPICQLVGDYLQESMK